MNSDKDKILQEIYKFEKILHDIRNMSDKKDERKVLLAKLEELNNELKSRTYE